MTSLNFASKILLAYFLVFSSILSNSPANSTEPQETETIDSTDVVWAAKWYNDRKSAFSFSFDDSFISHYENVRPILNQFNFSATFYVMPPWLTDSLPGIWRYGTWPMFQEMALEGHEIGSITMNHLHLPELEIGDTSTEGTILYEIYQSRELINQRIPNQQCITMAYPYAEHNELIDSLTSLFYESARADGVFPNPSSLTDEQWFALTAIEVLFNEPRNSLDDDLEELQFIQDWIDSLIYKEDWGILLAHEVVPQDSLPGLIADGAWNPYSNEWLTILSEWIFDKSDNNDVWVETIGNITRYIKERDNYIYSVLAYDDMQIKFNISDNLDDEIYNYPLSVFIKIPPSWDFALMMQGETYDTLIAFTNDSGKVVLTNVIPDGGEVTLLKTILTDVKDVADLIPDKIQLFQNYPNPFNPTTTIKYQIPSAETSRQDGVVSVQLNIYDVLGRKVATLVNEEKSAGNYQVKFSSKNLSSGIYIYSLRVGNNMVSKKMILAK